MPSRITDPHCLPGTPNNPDTCPNPWVQLQGCIPGPAVTRAKLDLHFTFDTSGKSLSHATLCFLSYKSVCASSAMTIHSVNSLGQGVHFAMCLHSIQA